MAIYNHSQLVYSSDYDGELLPRAKFNFTLLLNIHDQGIKTFTRVSDVSVPSYSFDTQIMNQYGAKRVVQTRMNYDPVTVNFYDTYDSQWHEIQRDYIRHYYNGSEGLDQRTLLEGESVVNTDFFTDEGYTLNARRYFFTTIKIIQDGYAGQYRETILMRPIITSMSGDTLDYSDSQPVKWTITFQPESIQVREVKGQYIPDLRQ